MNGVGTSLSAVVQDELHLVGQVGILAQIGLRRIIGTHDIETSKLSVEAIDLIFVGVHFHISLTGVTCGVGLQSQRDAEEVIIIIVVFNLLTTLAYDLNPRHMRMNLPTVEGRKDDGILNLVGKDGIPFGIHDAKRVPIEIVTA